VFGGYYDQAPFSQIDFVISRAGGFEAIRPVNSGYSEVTPDILADVLIWRN
jgi:hypothetical protein